MLSTLIHKRIVLAERGENPTVVCRMASGWLVMCDVQTPRGYCILLRAPVVGDLHELDALGRVEFLSDMAAAGEAILRVTGAYRMNYSILGNTDPALHAHLQPRFADEPNDQRRLPVWAFRDQVAKVAFDVERDAGLMAAIRLSLAALGKV